MKPDKLISMDRKKPTLEGILAGRVMAEMAKPPELKLSQLSKTLDAIEEQAATKERLAIAAWLKSKGYEAPARQIIQGVHHAK